MAFTLSDPTLLQAALEGLKLQKERIESQISTIESAIGGGARRGRPARAATAAAPAAPRQRRTMSAAARKRIAEAQRERWARYRKEKQQG
jgi:hypothetical protein